MEKESVEKMNKKQLNDLLASFIGIFSVFMVIMFLGVFFILKGLMGFNWVSIFSLISISIISIIYTIPAFRGLIDWDYEPKIHLYINIVIFIFITLLPILFIINQSHLIDKAWQKDCELRGLPDKCTQIDECKKSCEDFGKGFLRYERGGLFRNGDCWCINENRAEQIW